MINNEVSRNGKVVLHLNLNLITKQKLSQAEVDAIKMLHVERLQIEETLDQVHRVEDINYWYSKWVKNQYALQKSWGFPEDARWHASHNLKSCVCAKIDNDERIGTGMFVRTTGCPIHDPV